MIINKNKRDSFGLQLAKNVHADVVVHTLTSAGKHNIKQMYNKPKAVLLWKRDGNSLNTDSVRRAPMGKGFVLISRFSDMLPFSAMSLLVS